MARIKIDVPETFTFTCTIPVRITDINYGGHAGNDAILSLIHEARMQYLRQAGYTEVDFAGAGLIMADVAIEFKSEVFYGDSVVASVTVAEFSKVSFDIYYKLEKLNTVPDQKNILVALAKTGMVCFDYAAKKITGISEEAKRKLMAV